MIKKFVLGLLTFSVLSVPFAPASENLFQFQAPDIDGEKLSLRQFEGQVVLVVNTASKCGYTYQYEGLEKVYRQFKDRGFVVLGFPSDDFWQEYNSNEEIKEFCEGYQISFLFAEGPVRVPTNMRSFVSLLSNLVWMGKSDGISKNFYLIVMEI